MGRGRGSHNSRGFRTKAEVLLIDPSRLFSQILKRTQHLRYSLICCSATDATPSTRRRSAQTVFSTSPVSPPRHRTSRASNINKYQLMIRRTRTSNNIFKRHLSLSVSLQLPLLLALFLLAFHAPKEKSIAEEKFLSNAFVYKSAQVT